MRSFSKQEVRKNKIEESYDLNVIQCDTTNSNGGNNDINQTGSTLSHGTLTVLYPYSNICCPTGSSVILFCILLRANSPVVSPSVATISDQVM